MAIKTRYRIGPLRQRIALQENTPTKNAQHEVIHSWSTQSTVWGSVTPMSGSEILRAADQVGRVSHTVVIRKPSSLTLTPGQHRLLYDGRYFDIIAAFDVDERGRFLSIMANEHIT